jgi:tetratricopeptide (TPR) repeat protein
MKYSIVTFLLLGLAISLSAQKSKVLAVTQMIDAEKYDEAKDAIELALLNYKTSKWPRTYFTKGLLCQTAYEAGVEKKDTKKTNLYPDQLFVAYDSYEKALELDGSERLHTSIRQNYFLLDNDFRSLGEECYRRGEYEGALNAFEHALLIGNSELLSAKTDTNLVYNTAMAAYECKNWGKAIEYLTGLHEDGYSASASLLLAISYVKVGDTLRAEEVMIKGLEIYQYEDSIVMYLVNQMVNADKMEHAIGILDRAIDAKPENFRFYWARGLVYQEMNNNEEALKSFLIADESSPGSAELYYHIGVCYYNMGIDLRQSALQISENDSYLEARKQYLEKFVEAVKWLEQSYELNPSNQETVSTLYNLYDRLQMDEKQESLKQWLR